MIDSDFEGFAEVWEACYENYGKTPTPRAVNMAFDVLQRFELRQITQALTAHMNDPQQGQFAPKPADIVRNIEGTPDDAAMEAWGKVDHALRRVGYGPHLVFDDPKIHKVLAEMGGFAQFGKATEHDLGFLRQQFTKRYASCRDVTGYPGKITGWYTSGQTAMIGNQDHCQTVLDGGDGERVMITNASEAAARALEGLE